MAGKSLHLPKIRSINVLLYDIHVFIFKANMLYTINTNHTTKEKNNEGHI